MKLSIALLASVCLFPLITISHAEDVNKQNIRIVETTRVSMNEAEPNMQMNKDQIERDGKSSIMNNSGNDAEADKEQGFRWPWQKKEVVHKEKAKCC